ncbi:MAG: osmoprotectant transport system substrate-binding protein [Actinomycetota bacterium]|nr:osmoprotectant transport system substrate-binding protein [Actinomycetota bacterium]
MSPRSRGRSLLLAASLVLVAGAASSCAGGHGPSVGGRPRANIVLASFNFPESVLLAEIYAGALKAHGYTVAVRTDAGPREIVDPAMARGLVDFVPEYSGSALLFFGLGSVDTGPDIRRTHAALFTALAPHGLIPMAPAPAQDANAIVVTRATAQRYDLHAVSDLADVANILTFGGPSECPHRPLCLLGLRETYGLRFERFFSLDTGGGLTLQALVSGEIDVGLLFTTDPSISAKHLVVLADDRGLQPAENVTPVIRRTVLTRYGSELGAVVDGVSAKLTTRSVTTLNARLAAGGDPSEVARWWLASQGMG